MSDHNTPPSTVVTRPDGESYTIIDQHYEQIRSDRESLALYRSRAANYREAAAKLIEAATLLEEECRPIEARLSKAREFCQASLSDSPPSERASSVLSNVQQLASDALPVVQQLPAYNQAMPNGNGAVYPRHMGLQYVNAPATPPSPHREHQNYPPPERHHTGTPVSAQSYAPPYGRPLKRSRSMVEEDELEDDRKSSPRSLASTDGMVMKMLPHEQPSQPTQRKQGKFTDDDRHKIAAYLATTTSRAQNGGIDWKQFALSNPKYDATGWRTQYHSRKHKIDPLIDQYRPQALARNQQQHAQQQQQQEHAYIAHAQPAVHTPSVQAQPSPPPSSAYHHQHHAQPVPGPYGQPASTTYTRPLDGYAKPTDDARSVVSSSYTAVADRERERESSRDERERERRYAPESTGYATAESTAYASHSPMQRTPERPTSDMRDQPMEEREPQRELERAREPERQPQHQHEPELDQRREHSREREQDESDGPPAPPIAAVSAAEQDS